MQYHIQTLVKHLFDKDSFEQVTEQELKQFTVDYPYAAVGQFLYAKKLKEIGSYNHNEQGEQASLYFHNALWLRWQLDQKEEMPALPVHAEEAAQQPGFRIVVQMPKTGELPEIPVEQAPVFPAAADVPAEPALASAGPTLDKEEKTLQVNENGSLIEKEAAITQGAPEETASAVAIAENSQLAEEIVTTSEIAPNAVSITEEVMMPPTTVSQEIDKEADEIVPAVEVTNAELETETKEDDIVPAVDVTKIEMEVTAVADDIVPAIEVAPEELAAIAPVAAITTAPPEIAIEEQLVEENNEIIPAAEPVAITAQAPTQPAGFTTATSEGKMSVDPDEPVFESYHTIDYFASQGIKLLQEELKDKLGKQLKSFTEWLRSMKRVGPIESNTSLDDIANQSIQRIAEHSNEEKEVLTEAMAEVWAKQGNPDKAIRVYEKLSLLNPAKSPYFASRIEQLKAQ
ncbi:MULTISPECIES: hypothetical protein [Niastella]|uniref:Uncharacterized protein n=1 Tax=Niastella soli TaxID=2821487 RepID=A0ABS3YXL4_9BACT|nr:hypothetical protein [Niastella soli]MBO9202665.1 hypothetical protein [Niastella soli]